MENKKFIDMTEKEILRKQLELLAEHSEDCTTEELPQMTHAMCHIYELLNIKS